MTSKVLSYLCSGRPIVLAANEHNLAAKTLKRSGAGVVVDSRDALQFVDALRHFLSDAQYRAAAGTNGRNYADATFDIERIADRFEDILQSACR